MPRFAPEILDILAECRPRLKRDETDGIPDQHFVAGGLIEFRRLVGRDPVEQIAGAALDVFDPEPSGLERSIVSR